MSTDIKNEAMQLKLLIAKRNEKKAKLTSIKTSSGGRTKLLIYNNDWTEKECTDFRKCMRKLNASSINIQNIEYKNIAKFALDISKANEETEKRITIEFLKFYKTFFILNDFSLNSISKKEMDRKNKDFLEQSKTFIEVIADNKVIYKL